jgi:hypothetical protein
LRHYILNGYTPIRCDLMTWAEFFETHARTVAYTEQGDVRVSVAPTRAERVYALRDKQSRQMLPANPAKLEVRPGRRLDGDRGFGDSDHSPIGNE